MRNRHSRIAVLALAFAAAATPALAHPGLHHTSGFAAGLAHPVFGLDHLLAMVAVGVWAAQYRAPGAWLLPVGFVGGMIVGAGTAFMQIPLPAVESAIALSVVLIGAALSFSARMPLGGAVGLTAVSGLFHGHAHGLEASGAALSYIAGFVVATSLLHASGGAVGLSLGRFRFAAPAIGAAVAVAGVTLLAG